jgi:hypothetical protein
VECARSKICLALLACLAGLLAAPVAMAGKLISIPRMYPEVGPYGEYSVAIHDNVVAIYNSASSKFYYYDFVARQVLSEWPGYDIGNTTNPHVYVYDLSQPGVALFLYPGTENDDGDATFAPGETIDFDFRLDNFGGEACSVDVYIGAVVGGQVFYLTGVQGTVPTFSTTPQAFSGELGRHAFWEGVLFEVPIPEDAPAASGTFFAALLDGSTGQMLLDLRTEDFQIVAAGD